MLRRWRAFKVRLDYLRKLDAIAKLQFRMRGFLAKLLLRRKRKEFYAERTTRRKLREVHSREGQEGVEDVRRFRACYPRFYSQFLRLLETLLACDYLQAKLLDQKKDVVVFGKKLFSLNTSQLKRGLYKTGRFFNVVCLSVNWPLRNIYVSKHTALHQ